MPNGHCVETLDNLRTLYGKIAGRSVHIMCCSTTFSVETLWDICGMSVEVLWSFCETSWRTSFQRLQEICGTFYGHFPLAGS